MNILITGGAGFIGHHLSRYHAERGDNVYVIDNLFKSGGKLASHLSSLFDLKNVFFHKTDLAQPVTLKDLPAEFEIVYHLAAINGTKLFYEMPYQVARVNLLTTLNLLDYLGNKKVGRILYASSSEVYADADQVGLLKIPTDESIPAVFTQPTHSRFSYGTSKFMGEVLCAEFGKAKKVPTSIVRYHNVYGPAMGNHHVIPEFIVKIQKDENPLAIYGGEETRAFCYIDDAVTATVKVATNEATVGEIVHVGNSKEEIDIKNLAKICMSIQGKKFALSEKGRRESSVSRRCPDTTKLKSLTGFEAKVSLQEGLEKTTAWYLKN
jgi:UDP-glucose 4-epimerase